MKNIIMEFFKCVGIPKKDVERYVFNSNYQVNGKTSATV